MIREENNYERVFCFKIHVIRNHEREYLSKLLWGGSVTQKLSILWTKNRSRMEFLKREKYGKIYTLETLMCAQ